MAARRVKSSGISIRNKKVCGEALLFIEDIAQKNPAIPIDSQRDVFKAIGPALRCLQKMPKKKQEMSRKFLVDSGILVSDGGALKCNGTGLQRERHSSGTCRLR
jgi:hypothetical protein